MAIGIILSSVRLSVTLCNCGSQGRCTGHRRRRGIKCGYAECEAEEPRAVRGSWEGGSEPPPHQLECLGERCKLSQWSPVKTLNFVKLWDLKIESNLCNVAKKLYERV